MLANRVRMSKTVREEDTPSEYEWDFGASIKFRDQIESSSYIWVEDWRISDGAYIEYIPDVGSSSNLKYNKVTFVLIDANGLSAGSSDMFSLPRYHNVYRVNPISGSIRPIKIYLKFQLEDYSDTGTIVFRKDNSEGVILGKFVF